MRFYPALLFQRIWVKEIGNGFRTVSVKISKSIFNLNYNKSIFGGTIYCAADPFYAICFYQILRRKGLNIRIWVKSSEIKFVKPAFTSLHFSIALKDEHIEDICKELANTGKFSAFYLTEIFNKDSELCATVNNEVYFRKL